MTLPLEIVLTKNAAKRLEALDVPTRRRVMAKIEAVAVDPLNPVNSYPLQGTDRREDNALNVKNLNIWVLKIATACMALPG
jgi:mRNA-degrading endonuclease RelE of RelBE toxin-antitoxin system